MKLKLIILLSVFSLAALAQKVKTVEGEYTYHAPENATLEQARRTALERAQTQAIADAFGTLVQQQEVTRVENGAESSNVDYLSLGGVEVKGEWIETTGKPEYDIRYEDGMLVVTVRVKGKAREITSAAVEFKALVLCNGIEERNASETFRSGDDLYVSFQSPVKGFLTIYLLDAEKNAYCLLPYRNYQDGSYPVKANKQYVFFHEPTALPDDKETMEEYTMTCGDKPEVNHIYVIFSPHSFNKALDGERDKLLPRELTYEAFQRWLSKCRKHDADMASKIIPITIKP